MHYISDLLNFSAVIDPLKGKEASKDGKEGKEDMLHQWGCFDESD